MNARITNESAEHRIARLFARQFGVVSGEQAARLGATRDVIRRRVRSGRWQRLYPGVYRVAGAPPLWRASLMAACLACGSGALVSHRAASALRELAGFPEGAIELSAPGQRGRHLGFVVHRTAPLPRVDVAVVDGILATSVARTLIDVASLVPRDVLEEALDDALRRKLVSLPRLRWRIAELGGSGRPGIVAIRSLVQARTTGSPVPGSVFERRLLRLLEKAGLAVPALQHKIRRAGRPATVVDFAFPDARLAVEADGYRWHSGRVRWEHDLARRNALTAMGWRVLHVTWSDLTHRPNETVAAIAEALAEPTALGRRRRTAEEKAAR